MENKKRKLNVFSAPTNEELKERRVKLQQQYLKEKDIIKANSLYNAMLLIDSVLNRRKWGAEKPHGPAYHREHGYNLLKDD